ncbi:MAG: fibronectin type III domain-containing protein [Lewinellaceae bacterium]|nr:fibronectin type III domain-containing protein [Lewinellaceae bacterium]
MSAINTSYQNVPVFSWTVEVVTHELGHNLGSWHTQSCNWPGGALDNCYPTEGGCSPGPAPANGGTIMSYCHLTNYGINFNNGFGTLPGNRIRDKVQAATCLSASGVAPVGLNAGNITTSSATLSWGIVAGATTYTVQYKTAASSSWITAGNTTSASYNLTGLTANTNYNWQVKTDCSNYSPAASFTTSSNGNGNGGACPVPTGLSNTNITASSAKLNWSAVSGASSYTVQYKRSSVAAWTTAGSTVSTSYTINSLSAASAYNWRVKANCSNYSGTATFVTLSNSNGSGTTCNPPGNLTNLGITAKTAGISWSAVSGASNYTLQIKYASSNTWYTLGTIPVTQVTISGLQPATSYHWRVKASCSGYSSPKLLTTPGFLQDQDEAESAGVVQAPAVHFIRIYPNPASDLLNLQYTGDLLPDSRIMVTDIAGRVVLHESLTQESQTIDISGLQQGVYLLVVMQGNGRKEVERFVKM